MLRGKKIFNDANAWLLAHSLAIKKKLSVNLNDDLHEVVFFNSRFLHFSAGGRFTHDLDTFSQLHIHLLFLSFVISFIDQLLLSLVPISNFMLLLVVFSSIFHLLWNPLLFSIQHGHFYAVHVSTISPHLLLQDNIHLKETSGHMANIIKIHLETSASKNFRKGIWIVKDEGFPSNEKVPWVFW